MSALSVREELVAARPTAVIAATTTWAAFPSLWRELLAEVWEVVRPQREAILPGRNVMRYAGDAPDVEIGCEVDGVFAGSGRVVASALPAGRVATTLHVGPAGDVGEAHARVIAWCDARGLDRTGVRWEVYAHHPTQEVEVYYLLR